MDVLVILDTIEETESLYALAFDIGLEHEVVISPHIKTKENFEARKTYPFLQNVRNEGDRMDDYTAEEFERVSRGTYCRTIVTQ